MKVNIRYDKLYTFSCNSALKIQSPLENQYIEMFKTHIFPKDVFDSDIMDWDRDSYYNSDYKCYQINCLNCNESICSVGMNINDDNSIDFYDFISYFSTNKLYKFSCSELIIKKVIQ